MLQELFNFFQNVVFKVVGNHWLSYGFNDLTTIQVFGVTLKFNQYLQIVCTYISLIIILVLCCLFVWKLIKLVGRLFSGGSL